jgi:hypothetical protein
VTPEIKHEIRQMLGEILREVGVLVVVLAPLESLVTHGALTPREIAVTLLIAVPCLGFGVVLGLEHR